MYQYDDPTVAATLPTPAAPGAAGYFTDGSAGSGTPATILRSDYMNMLMLELLNVVVAAGITPSKTTYNQLLTAIRATTADSARVVGLVAQNNATTPNTQFDFSALSVTVRNPTTGATSVTQNSGTITNNILNAGPAANGRDQAGVFGASQWLRFYYIWNPTTSTLATISSSAAPGVGPALPSGFTSWAYIGSVYYGSGSTLAQGNIRGARWQYSSSNSALNAGTSTGLVAVPIPTLVPPEAGWFEIFFQQLIVTAAASGGGYSVNCQITTQTNSIFNIGFSGVGTPSNAYSQSGPSKQITNFNQSFAYAITAGLGVAASVTIYVTGYSIPNGGE